MGLIHLYSATSTTFDHNGTPLVTAREAVVKRDEGFQLTFNIPISQNELHKRVQKEMIVSAMTPDGVNYFRIWDIEKRTTDVKVTALQLLYSLDVKQINPFGGKQHTGDSVLQAFANSFKSSISPYTFSSSILTLMDFYTNEEDDTSTSHNALAILNKITDSWSGELMLNGFDVRMVSKLGTKTDALLYERKNIASFSDSSSMNGIVTRIYATATYTPERAEGDTEDPEPVVLTATVDSPLINQYAVIYEATAEYNDARTVDELRTEILKQYSEFNVDKPERTIDVDTNIVDGTAINFGDELVLKYLVHDVDEVIRCVGYEYDPISENYIGVTLGTLEKTFLTKVSEGISSSVTKQFDKISRDIQSIQTAANGKNRIAYGPSPVPNAIEGDLWFYHPEGRPDEVELLVYQNGLWIPAPFLTDQDRADFDQAMTDHYNNALAEIERKDAEYKEIFDDYDETVVAMDQEISDTATKAQSALDEAGVSTDLAQTAKDLAATAEANASTAKTNASTAMANASTAKTNAQTALDDASTAKTNAQTAIDDAQTAITNSTQAQTDASTALSQAGQAVTASNTAKTNAQEALDNSSTAITDAADAITKAGQAETTANTAKTNAQTALDDAQSALTTAGSADSKAGQAIAKANAIPTTITDIIADKNLVNGTYVDTKVDDATGAWSQELVRVEGVIDGIEIGGRNYLLNSDTELSTSGTLLMVPINNVERLYPLIGETITISLDIRADEPIERVDFYLRNNSTSNIVSGAHSPKFNVSESFERYSHSFELVDISELTSISFTVRDTSGVSRYVQNIKLEKGNKATDWTPAPEDLYSQEEFKIFNAQYTQDVAGITGRLITVETDKLDGSTFQTFKQAEYQVTADKVASTITRVDTAEGKITTQGTAISQQATAIASKADKTVVDTLAGTVSTQGTSISQNATDISSKADSELVDDIKGTVDTHTTEISQNATDIASKASTSSVNTLTGRVSTAETNISQNATAISSKANTSTVNSLTGRVSTAETTLTQQANLIASKASQTEFDTVKGTVASHTTTIAQQATQISARLTNAQVETLVTNKGYSTVNYVDNQIVASASGIRADMSLVEGKIDNLQIGGRNLLLNSNFSNGLTNWQVNGTATKTTIDGRDVVLTTNVSGRGFYTMPTTLTTDSLYTISFDAKSVGETSRIRVGFLNDPSNNSNFFTVTSTWRRYSYTINQPLSTHNQLLHFYGDGANIGAGAYITNIQLEKGNVATDWTPAPEDTLMQNDFNVFKASYEATAEALTSRITAVDKVGGRLATAETNISQNATAISSKANTSTVNSLTGRVSTAETTLTQQANLIASKASQTEVDTVKGTVSSHTTTLSQHATQISARLTNAQVNTLVDSKGFSTINYVDNQITASASGIRADMSLVEGKIPLDTNDKNYLTNSEVEWETTSFTSNSAYGVYRVGQDITDIFKELVGQIKISVDVFIENAELEYASFRVYGTNGLPRYQLNNLVIGNVKTNEWVRVSGTIDIVDKGTGGHGRIELYGNGVPSTTKIRIRKMKIGKVYSSDTWSPAPEDALMRNDFNTFKASYEATAQSLTSRLTAIDKTDGRLAQAESLITQTANGLTQRYTKTETNTLLNAKATTASVTALSTEISTVAGQMTQRYTKTEVNNLLTNKANTSDLNGLATQTWTNNQITSSATGTMQEITRVENKIPSLAGYATQTWTNNQISTTASSITSTISQVESKIDGLQVGGRNLVPNSKLIEHPIGLNSRLLISGGLSEGTYTISFDYEVDSIGVGLNNFLIYAGVAVANVPLKQTGDKRVKQTFTVTPTHANNNLTIYFGHNSVQSSQNAGRFIELQIEKGNVATDWSPAPEDLATVTALTQATQDLSGFKTLVQQTYGTKSEVSAVTQTANNLVTELTRVENKIPSLSGYATQAWSTTQINTKAGEITTSLTTEINKKATPAQITSAILADKSILDTRSTNQTPAWYFTNHPRTVVREFKYTATLGIGAGSYGVLTTDVPWSDSSGGTVKQTFIDTDGVEFIRRGTTTAWTAWETMSTNTYVNTTVTQKAGEVTQLITEVKTNPTGTIVGYNSLTNNVNSMVQAIGTDGGKIAQMVMTDSLFSTKVLEQVQVGGRNLVPNSDFNIESNLSGVRGRGSSLIYSDIPSDYSQRFVRAMLVNAPKDTVVGMEVGISSDRIKIVEGQTYTLSFISTSSGSVIQDYDYMYIMRPSGANRNISSSLVKKERIGTAYVNYPVYKYQYTFTSSWSDENAYLLIGTYTSFVDPYQWIRVAQIQLEKGNVATDWSPAPEDKANQSEVTQLAGSWALTLKSGDDVKTQINASTNSIRLASKLIHLSGNSLIDNATIKSAHIDTLNANKIVGNTADFNTIRTGVLVADAVTSTHIKADTALFNTLFSTTSATTRLVAQGAWIENANIIGINASKITAGTISADRISTSSLNNINIGGSNLLLNSRNLNLVGTNAPGITRSFNAEGNLRITATAGNGNYVGDMGMNPSRPNVYANVKNGDSVTFSVEARSTNTTSKPDFYFGSGGSYLPLQGNLGTTWSKLYVTISWNVSDWTPHFGFKNVVGTIELRNVQLEKGDMATDWSPAVTEVTTKNELAQSGQVVIHGGNIKADTLDVGAITGNKATFISTGFKSLNSQATINGHAIRIQNSGGEFVEMNNTPELRSDDAGGTAVVLGKGRVHFYDSRGYSKGYVGTDMHTAGSYDFGTFLSKGSGIYKFARMADATQTTYAYYTIKAGITSPSGIITNMVQNGYLPDGNAQQFVAKGNMLSQLNGWPAYPNWPTLSAGQQIRYKELTTQTTGDAYEDIWKFGPSSQGDWRIYFAKHATFEGGTTGTSDRRLKHDIETTQIEALGHIESLAFKEFRWNRDNKYEPLGLIAQDSGIIRVADDDMEGIDIQRAIMLGLKGVQELQALVKEQAAKIKQLEEINNQ